MGDYMKIKGHLDEIGTMDTFKYRMALIHRTKSGVSPKAAEVSKITWTHDLLALGGEVLEGQELWIAVAEAYIKFLH